MKRILSALGSAADVPKYSHIAYVAEIAENGYNLNIPRYVDTYEPPPPIDILEVTKELLELSRERAALDEKICGMISEMVVRDEQTAAELEAVRKMFAAFAETAKPGRGKQISLEDLL